MREIKILEAPAKRSLVKQYMNPFFFYPFWQHTYINMKRSIPILFPRSVNFLEKGEPREERLHLHFGERATTILYNTMCGCSLEAFLIPHPPRLSSPLSSSFFYFFMQTRARLQHPLFLLYLRREDVQGFTKQDQSSSIWQWW